MNQLQLLTKKYKDNKKDKEFFDFFQIRILKLQKKSFVASTDSDEYAIQIIDFSEKIFLDSLRTE